MRFKGSIFAVAALFVLGSAQPSSAEDDTSYVAFGLGAFDFYQRHDLQVEFRLEYRGPRVLGPIKPYVSLSGTACPDDQFNFCPGKGLSGSGFFGGGGYMDFPVSDNWIISPSIGLAGYFGGTEDLDLDSPFVARFQVEAAYQFKDKSRMGFAVSRYDTLGTADKNPGVETFTLYISVPID